VVHFARRLVVDESGVTAVEYGLLSALIATALIAAIPGVGAGLGHALRVVANALEGHAPTMVRG
jgi:pilus assembly protein Flp/PilA